MDIRVADERILLFKEQVSKDDAKKRAWEKKVDAFGAINKVASFLSRPKDDDFTLIHEEHRLQPFWHVAAKAHYVYDRRVTYQVPVGGHEVLSVTVEGKEFVTTNGHIHPSAVEHCTEDLKEDVYVDGISGEKNTSLSDYLSFSVKEVDTADLTKVVGKEMVLVPPQARVSALMREILARMIQGIQADNIFEENVEVTSMDLCYHPVFAFQYRWTSKNKEAIIEVDALTGHVQAGNRLFKEYLGKVLDKNFLFDIGADAAGVFIPGGSIAVKVARKYMETKKIPKS